MRRKTVSGMMLTLLSIGMLALAFNIQPASAEPRKVGVEVGDWAKYEITYDYKTNDPNPPVPPPSPWIADIDDYRIEVLSVTGTSITFQIIIHLKNGTEITDVVVTMDVSDPPTVYPPVFIAANLSAGDTLYPGAYAPVINATLMRTYAGVEREVNFVDLMLKNTYPPNYQVAGSLHMYWDRATGILDEMTQSRKLTEPTKGYETYLFGQLVMKETNIWGPMKSLLGTGWGWMYIAPREYVYGPAELYKIGDTEIELVITYEGEDYSRIWNIIIHKEHECGETYLCYSDEWRLLIVGLHKHERWQFWFAIGKGLVAFGFSRSWRLRLTPT